MDANAGGLDVIPFYGAEDREMFRIEREAMDRSGRVIATLDNRLPDGAILDIGAGDGFTAEALTTPSRPVVALEPAAGMIDTDRPVRWVRGVAQRLPLRDDSFAACYSTWAYFFPSYHDISAGLSEARRVVATGGTITVVDNAGDDAFTAMADRDIAADLDTWSDLGFDIEVIETAFEFASLADAERLLTFYFGERTEPALYVPYRVAVMTQRVTGSE